MSAALRLRLLSATFALLRVAAGTVASVCIASCENFVDADDALCHALASAKNGLVDWPEHAHWYSDPNEAYRIFDHAIASPWRFDSDARDYIEGFGLAQGHNWGHLGREDVMTFHAKSFEVDTPLARTYNGYSNIVYANIEGNALDRGRSLGDFEYYDTFLKWSTAYVFQKSYRVSGNCRRACESVESNNCVIARTVNGRFRNDFIDLYQTFFYEIDSVWRAAVIVHEVRHAHDGVQHDGATACPDQSTCDRNWSSGGANTYEALWLAAFYYASEKHPFISDMRRARAKSLFHEKLRGGFATPALWSLHQLQGINEIPEIYVRQAACSEDPQQPHYCVGLASR